MDEKIARSVIRMLLIDSEPLPLSIVHHRTGVPVEHLQIILEQYPKNFKVIYGRPDVLLKLLVPVGICTTHSSNNKVCSGPPSCSGLHICKFYMVSDTCRFGNKCTFGHDLSTSHNVALLQQYLLDNIPIAELKKMFQNSRIRTATTLPKICSFYNGSKGCRCCETGKCCIAIHICRYYILGKCTFGVKCMRNHDVFDPFVKETLEKHGFHMHRTANEILADLRHAQDCGDDDEEGETEGYPNERGAAAYAQSVQESPARAEQAKQELIPRARQTATQKLQEPRRTASAKMQNDILRRSEVPQQQSQQDCDYMDPLRHEAVLDNKYAQLERPASAAPKHSRSKTPDVKPKKKPIPKTTGSQPSSMTQTSVDGCRDPDICIFHLQRRCQFGSKCRNMHCDLMYQWQFREADRDEWTNFQAVPNKEVELTYSDPCNSEFCANIGRASPMKDAITVGSKVQTPVTLPKQWNITTGEDAHEHFKQVEIKKDFPSTTKEYKFIEALFYETMPSTASITSILRVENGDLWLNYVSKKEKMRKRNGDLKVDERHLFHGTSTQYVNAICQQGFDFRLSGQTTGSIYGKGSYFASGAKYSDDYVEDQNRMMFVGSVLVGDFVKGEPSYVRPPLKDTSDLCSALYDSCVNDMEKASIFVVFEFNQCYPEYVIKYDMKY